MVHHPDMLPITRGLRETELSGSGRRIEIDPR
jgi:hypothetical protein